MKPLLDRKAVAGILGVSEYTVADMARRGIFPRGVVVKLGRLWRWNPDALNEWCAAGGNIEPSNVTPMRGVR